LGKKGYLGLWNEGSLKGGKTLPRVFTHFSCGGNLGVVPWVLFDFWGHSFRKRFKAPILGGWVCDGGNFFDFEVNTFFWGGKNPETNSF